MQCQEIYVHYFPDSVNSPGLTTMMKCLDTIDGMRIRHVVSALELHGISYYNGSLEGSLIDLEDEIRTGENYLLHPKNRRHLRNNLDRWSVSLRGIRKRISEERSQTRSS